MFCHLNSLCWQICNSGNYILPALPTYNHLNTKLYVFERVDDNLFMPIDKYVIVEGFSLILIWKKLLIVRTYCYSLLRLTGFPPCRLTTDCRLLCVVITMSSVLIRIHSSTCCSVVDLQFPEHISMKNRYIFVCDVILN